MLNMSGFLLELGWSNYTGSLNRLLI